jgi:hypothetical protein
MWPSSRRCCARSTGGSAPDVGTGADTRRRGRPPRLNAELGAAIVSRIASGDRVEEAAREVGIAPRTLRSWRERAWSRAPDDQPYVRLEQELRNALVVAERRRVSKPAADWREAARWLEVEAGWGLEEGRAESALT